MTYDPRKHRHTGDPDTAQKAARAACGLAERHMSMVLDTLGQDGPQTAWEMADRFGFEYVQVAKRCSDLVQAGRIEDSGRRRPSPSGRDCIVWRLPSPWIECAQCGAEFVDADDRHALCFLCRYPGPEERCPVKHVNCVKCGLKYPETRHLGSTCAWCDLSVNGPLFNSRNAAALQAVRNGRKSNRK